MIVLLDIDDTISLTASVWKQLSVAYFSARGIKCKYPSSSRPMEYRYDLTPQQRLDYLACMEEVVPYDRLSPALGAADFVQELLFRGHSVEFVTARPISRLAQTIEWIKHYLGIQNPVVHFQRFANMLQFDVLVDNSEERLRSIDSPTSLLVLFTAIAPIRRPGSLPKHIIEAKTYNEVLNLIDMRFQ